MVDVTKTSGSKRTSFSKSRVTVSEAGRTNPGVTLRDTPRNERATPATPSGLSDVFQQFYPALRGAAEISNRDYIQQETRRNAVEIERLKTAIITDPAAAKSALKSGGVGVITPSLEDRQVIQDNFKRMTARAMAYQDRAARQELLNGLDDTEDPDEAIANYITTQTEGSDPIFAAEFASAAVQDTAKQVESIRLGRIEKQQFVAESRARLVMQNELSTGGVPPTLEGIKGMRDHMFVSMPATAYDRQTAFNKSVAIVDEEIIKRAAKDDPLAIQMMAIKDPELGGTSIADRNPGKLDEVIASYIKKASAVPTYSANQNLDAIEERLAAIDAAGGNTQDYIDAYTSVLSHKETYGDTSDRYRTILAKAASKIENGVILNDHTAKIMSGLIPQVSSANHKALVLSMQDGTFIQRETQRLVEEQSMDPEQAQRFVLSRTAQYLANTPAIPEMKQALSSRMLRSDNEQEIDQTVVTLKGLEMNGADMRDFVDPEALALYRAVSANPQNKAAIIQQFRETAANPDIKLGGMYGRRTDRSGKEIGTEGYLKGTTEALGLVRDTYVFGTFDKEPDIKGVSQSSTVQAIAREALDTAAYVLAGQPVTEVDIQTLAATLMQDRIGLAMDGDGDPVFTAKQSPKLIQTADGQVLPGGEFTNGERLRAKEYWSQGENSTPTRVHIGEFGGLRQDGLTAQNKGMQVMSSANGFPSPVTLPQNYVFNIPRSALEADEVASKFFRVVGEEGDVVTLAVPPGGQDIEIDNNTFYTFDSTTGVWSYRYRDYNMSRDDLNAKNLEARGDSVGSPVKAPAGAVQSPPVRKSAPMGWGEAYDPAAATDKVDVDPMGKALDSVVDYMRAKGILSPGTKPRPGFEPKEDLSPNIEEYLKSEQANGGNLDDRTKPMKDRWAQKTMDLISKHEGEMSYVYDDRTTRRWKFDGKNVGLPTIGIGFNLKRKDAPQRLAEVGADYEKVMAGEQELNKDQRRKLFAITIAEASQLVRENFSDVELTQNQLMALTSLAFNNPSLVLKKSAPKLNKAIREGRWEDAAWEIEHNSGTQGKKAEGLPGLFIRRAEEAAIFRGVK